MSGGAGPLPEDVRRLLATASLGRRIYFFPETASTNDVALALARSGERDGTLVIADHQRAGRGRRGHTWSAPRGSDLLFSLVLRPDGNARDALPVTLAFATAIAVTLSKLFGVDVGVEWPNDVVTPRGKIAGILAESATSAGVLSYAVVGVGINVNSTAADFPDDVRGAAVSCRMLCDDAPWDRAMLLADVLGGIEAYYDRYRRDGFAPLRDAYEARLGQMGKTVAFDSQGVRRTGRVLGVADDGALRVDSGDGEILLYSESVEVVA